jgi:hypothetical protein
MVVHPASNPVAEDELDILDIPAKPKLARSNGNSPPHRLPLSALNGIDERAIEVHSG